MDQESDQETVKPRRKVSKASNVRGNLINSGLLNVIGLVTGFCVTRQIGAEEKGVYAFLLLFSSFFMPVLTFGVNNGTRYLISSKVFRIRDTLFSCYSFGVLHGCLTASIISTLWSLNLLGNTGNDLSFSIFLPVMLMLPIRGAAMAMEVALVADSQFKFVNNLALIESIVNSTLMWTLVIFLDWGLQGIVVTVVAAAVVDLTISMLYSWNIYRPTIRVDFSFLRRSLDYGLKSMLGFFSKRVNFRLDHVVLGILGAPASLGVYSVATTIAEMIWKLEGAIGPVFFNKMAETKDSDQRNELLGRMIRMVLLTLTVSAVPVVLLCHVLIPWGLGEEFKSVTPLLIVLLPGIIVGSAFRILNKFFGATGNPWLMSLTQVSAMVFALIFYWPFIHFFGLMGAAVASTLVYMIATVASLRLLGKNYQGSMKELMTNVSVAKDVKWMISQLKRSVRISAAK